MREQKIYKSNYPGRYFEYLEGNIFDIRRQPIKSFSIDEVERENLLNGGLYVLENGRIILLLDEDVHVPYMDTELVSGEKYYELTKKQLKLFWTIVKNKEFKQNGLEE